MPQYQTQFSAGCDIHALDNCNIPPGKYAIIGTGLTPDFDLAIAMGEVYQIEVRSRSGLAANYGVSVLNSPGTIDMDYTGEIKIILMNHGENTFNVARGDRIAQLVLMPVSQASALEIKSVTRGTDGFGSTGV